MIQAIQTIADNIQAASQPGLIEYLSIGISLVSVLVSGVAIWFAIRVADKQNKIALFEKRTECYHELKKHLIFAKMSIKLDNIGEVKGSFTYTFSNGSKDSIDDMNLLQILIESQRKLEQVPYLFQFTSNAEIEKIKTCFSDVLIAFMEDKTDMNVVKDVLKPYYNSMIEFETKYGENIQNHMMF